MPPPDLRQGDVVVIDGRSYALASIGTQRAELRRVADHESDVPEEALRKLLADWFNGELFRISERGHSGDWPVLIEDAKARHDTFGIPWSNSFVPSYVREMLAMQDD